MLNPSMQELMKNVNNRYLLVNLAAQRARDIAQEAEDRGEKIPEKPVKIALDEIAAGKIEYKEGPKPQPERLEDIVSSSTFVPDFSRDVSEQKAAEDILEEEL